MIGNIINDVLSYIRIPMVFQWLKQRKGALVSANRFQIVAWASSVIVKCMSGGVIGFGFISSPCHCVSRTILGKLINHIEPHLTTMYEVGTIMVHNM